MRRCHSRRAFAAALAGVLLAIGGTGAATAQTRDKITMVIFGAPSLGAFLPPIIKAQKFDEANNLEIDFQERPPDAYAAQYNSGEFKVGGSASVMQMAPAQTRGVKTSYLFNIFDFWGAVVTNKPEIKTMKDLEGKQLAAARATTNYSMFEWLAGKQGVDVSKIAVVNTAPPGLIGFAMADRADAVQIWEPAYTILMSRKPEMRRLDDGADASWKAFTGGSARIPYLGVAAHQDWIDANKALIPRLYKAYAQAAEWLKANPDPAAALIAPKATAADIAAVAASIRANDRLSLNLSPAGDVRKEIELVYRAGVELNFLAKMPSEASIYAGPMK